MGLYIIIIEEISIGKFDTEGLSPQSILNLITKPEIFSLDKRAKVI